MRKLARAFAAALAAVCIFATADAHTQALQASFDLVVPHPPTPVSIGGTTHLVYELHLTNLAIDDLALTRIEVLDANDGAALVALFEDSAINRLLGRPGLTDRTADMRVVAPGMRAVAYFWIPLRARAEFRALTHRIAFRPVAADARAGVTEGARVDVQTSAIGRPLGPPLRGGPWVAVYDPGMERGHRRVLFAHDGRVRIPARFAIDWMKIDEQGRLAHGDDSQAANHHSFGADVLAVADATVLEVRDAIADRTTISNVRHGLEKASGNHITLDLGDGRFVSYEHLLAGSIRVAVGASVKRGQVIARIGYSGDATAPHLHIHVSDGPTPLAGEGVPYVLEELTLLGAYPTIADFARGGPWARPQGGAGPRRMELPAANVVVEFGG